MLVAADMGWSLGEVQRARHRARTQEAYLRNHGPPCPSRVLGQGCARGRARARGRIARVSPDYIMPPSMTADRVPSLHRLARSWGRTACTNC